MTTRAHSVSGTAAIAQWGNSSAVRIPAPILRAAGLGVRDELILTVEDERIIMRRDMSSSKSYLDFAGALSHGEAEAMLTALKDTEQVDLDEW